ncbi:MAG: hypothetical protein EZS28_045591 [Streblomastix strix]|uniref:Uncharacterized protein n=1 Tax=Streblomastix strix TaxID=222440 RepID=A0A5J4TLZ4_9EUKA|nr:MAG: hypothetical protein EZS28_045591 [Streblomastix strix]
MGMQSSKRNSYNETEETVTSSIRFRQYGRKDKDMKGDNSTINSEVIWKIKLLKTVIIRIFTLPEHNGPSESIGCKTEMMQYNDDNEQNSNPRYKLVESQIQGEHSSTININTTTNDNDNGCSSEWMRFNTRERTGNDCNGSWNLEQKINEIVFRKFMSTTKGYGEVAIDASNQARKKEFQWIYPSILRLQAVLKNV